MRAALINTGTELLLGDVQDAHLAFIAREIFPLGLRILERRTVPDTEAIGRTLTELFPHCEILFVTGGLGQRRTISRGRWWPNRSDCSCVRTRNCWPGFSSDCMCVESNRRRALHARPKCWQARMSFPTRTEAQPASI